MYNKNYYKIKQYCNVINDFQIYVKSAQMYSPFHFNYWMEYIDDILQIIAVNIFVYSEYKERCRAIHRELYYFFNKVLMSYPLSFIECQRKKTLKKAIEKFKKQNKRKYYPDYYTICENCKIKEKRYLYNIKMINKKLCYRCYRKFRQGKL